MPPLTNSAGAQVGHTPGPWVCVEWECDPRHNEDGNRYWGIKPQEFHSGADYLEASGWMTEANARLIAAAPDLLAALRQFIPSNVALGNANWPDSTVVPLEVTLGELRAAAAAIAIATGPQS